MVRYLFLLRFDLFKPRISLLVLYRNFVRVYIWVNSLLNFRSSSPRREITKFPSETSKNARDLLKRMLKKSPRERITFSSLLSHSWFSGQSYRPTVPEKWEETRKNTRKEHRSLGERAGKRLELEQACVVGVEVEDETTTAPGDTGGYWPDRAGPLLLSVSKTRVLSI